MEEILCEEENEEAAALCFLVALSLPTKAAVLRQNNRDERWRVTGVHADAHIRVNGKAWSHP